MPKKKEKGLSDKELITKYDTGEKVNFDRKLKLMAETPSPTTLSKSKISDIDKEDLINVIKTKKIKIPLTNKDYKTLIKHFRNNDLNQFYLFIIQKVLTKKQFTETNNNILTGLTALLADKLGTTSTNLETDDEIVILIDTVYAVLVSFDIDEISNYRF
jgi:hypothetical protein